MVYSDFYGLSTDDAQLVGAQLVYLKNAILSKRHQIWRSEPIQCDLGEKNERKRKNVCEYLQFGFWEWKIISKNVS